MMIVKQALRYGTMYIIIIWSLAGCQSHSRIIARTGVVLLK
jgi:hypothetical protein